ncbi:MAG: amino acid ABC transporter ATP-binding protein [Phycisphaerae bacterium]|nr:amino acid ABC transporter ATP-binding protein [Phycisphaerae bacterium]
MIKVENVQYAYHTGTEALRDVSVAFPRGTISAVLGESGSGKTTLLMLLGQFLRPDAGRITLDNRDIYEIPEPEYRRALGIVFQNLYLFPHMTVLENMTLAPVKVLGADKVGTEDDARAMLDRLGIGEIADSYPSQISGGQGQRAAIARGLMLQPEYMLLDEPTSALDANTTDEFAAWLRELSDQTNFIIVTHDVLFADKAAHQGVYLSDGQVLDTGTIDTIIQHVRSGRLVEVDG